MKEDKANATTLEVELARREVMRNFKCIKEAIESFKEEAEDSEEYTKKQAITAFRCILNEVEKQTALWIFANQKIEVWDEV